MTSPSLAEAKILVPVDFSDESLDAVKVALDIAEAPKQVHVAHMLLEPEAGHPTDAIWATIDHMKRREDAQRELERRVAERTDEALTLHIGFGEPGMRIAELAATIHAGLIVMPSHGRTGMKRMLMGSVAERVLRQSHCPVLILRS